MEPVGQKPRFGGVVPSEKDLLPELLLKLLDLSRGEGQGQKIVLSLPAALLSKSFDSAPALPVRLVLSAPPLRKEMERLLGEALPGSVTLEVERDGNRLLWNVRGKERIVVLATPLLHARPSVLYLEDPKLAPQPGNLPDREEALFPARSLLAAIPPRPDEPVVRTGGALAVSGAGTLSSAGPVAVWPAFFPGRTIALTVRWMPEEESRGGEASSGRPGGEVAFTLEIPWMKGREGASPEKVLLTGLWGKDGIALQGRNLPEDFLKHFESRREILVESLRVFPGVEFSARLGGRSSRIEESDDGRSHSRRE